MVEECVKFLKETEGLCDESAYEIVNSLVALKLLEQKLDTEIKIKEYDYNFSHVVENNFEYRKNLFDNVKFSTLSKKPENEIPVLLKIVWDDVLSVHPQTKHIFKSGKCVQFKNVATYKFIMNQII